LHYATLKKVSSLLTLLEMACVTFETLITFTFF